MNPSLEDNQGDKPLLIRRGRVESVDLYEIKDAELDLFERGSPADLQLNFAIFLLSTAFSSIIALVTASFSNETVHTTFVVVAVVGLLIGAYLLIAWWRNRTSVRTLCGVIRRRIKETTSIAVINKGAVNADTASAPDTDVLRTGTEASEPKG